GSMTDLFGKWTPREWIEAILSVARDCPHWNFLFLSKYPGRMAEFEFPPNCWVGTSVDSQARVAPAEDAFARVTARVKWLSCEPPLEPLNFQHLDRLQWMVLGGASRSTQTREFRPPRGWVNELERQARAAGVLIYEKDNLLERICEYPGHAREEPRADPPQV